MRVLTIVHERDAGPGVFHDALAAAGAEVETWVAAEQLEPPARPGAYDAILSFGGSVHPDQEERHPWLATEKRFLAEALRKQVPLLGICLGAELIAEADGTRVRKMAHPEIGWYELQVTDEGAADPLLGPLGPSFPALEWHSYEIPRPAEATVLAGSASCLQAYRLGACAWGLQFHAEVTADDFQLWLDDFASDEDAVAEGIDPAALARETDGQITAWNDLGRGICERFLAVAAERRVGRHVRAAL